MTTQNKATLTALFEQGDIPSGTNFADFIDSCVNVAETSAQSLQSKLNATEFATPRVSATNANITGTLSAATASIDTVTASSLTLTGGISIGGNVSGVNIYSSDVRCSAVYFTGKIVGQRINISAAGSTQATAAPLTGFANYGAGVVDGQATGYLITATSGATIQYLFNNGASANLYPPSGGKINGLATNAAYSVAASSLSTIIHFSTSAFGVK